ncbi:MAG: 3-phosphoshikimate 1-carboxyvinyltransferase [Dehalococcoidia bacterium]|nr:3-phosphoshikimate 1-carboxyvinyltransferase [Dehalococcoidia bacterium]
MSTHTVVRPKKLRGEIIAPGDKSVSHRAAMLNAIAHGTATVTNYAPGNDCAATVNILRMLGIDIERTPAKGQGGDTVIVHGRGSEALHEPDDILYAGGSGTTMRLMSGILAGRPFMSVLTGDETIRVRPMDRILKPLGQMGALVHGRAGGRLPPIVFSGGQIKGIEYSMPVASAQLKSCLVLAGLRATEPTVLHQPAESRDHTERMMRAMGGNIRTDGLTVTVVPGDLHAVDVPVPGDISSAAFWIVAGLIHPDAELLVRNVGINPTRAGVIDALRLMGADLRYDNERDVAGEPVADIIVKSSHLHGAHIGGDLVPLLIDEIPVLAIAAAMAEGRTEFTDVVELRVKETDRIAATVDWMTSAGVIVESTKDTMVVHGAGHIRGGEYKSYSDHRMAMSLAVAGLVSDTPVTVMNSEAAAKSYPGFWDDMERFGLLAG